MPPLSRDSPPKLLVVLSSDPEGRVVGHRWRAYEGALAQAGVRLEVVAWPLAWAARRRARHRAEAADGVVVSSRLLPLLEVRRLRRRARRLALDFDDALPWRVGARGATRSLARTLRFRALVRAADAVFAGNETLAALAADAGREAVVLPTVVDVPPAPPPAEPSMPPTVLGWIGSRSTLPYLEDRWLPLGAIVASGRPIRLRVIADRPARIPPGIAMEYVPWTEHGWREALAGIHVGLAPLPDDPWTRGMCGLEVLQTMSVGRPVVASAVGVQVRQVVHGQNGFLARSREEFLDGLLALLEDDGLRRRAGRAAWEAARGRWSVQAWAPRFVEVVRAWLP